MKMKTDNNEHYLALKLLYEKEFRRRWLLANEIIRLDKRNRLMKQLILVFWLQFCFAHSLRGLSSDRLELLTTVLQVMKLWK